MPIVLDGTNGITQADQFNSDSTFGFKNRIINGAMVNDQRNAGASVSTGTLYTIYTVDRWQASYSAASKYTIQQNAGSITPPVGFTNYLGLTSSSAYSVGSSDYFGIQQVVEGYNIADLGWGTANAKTITISFWVYSSLTGTFGGALQNSGGNYNYPFSYTITSANTWQQISITIAGPTSGSWNTTNGAGIYVFFSIGTGATYSATAGTWTTSLEFSATGATSVVGTNGATFYITGVQLEVGSTATSFDYLPYGTELQLCQRYFWKPTDYGYGLVVSGVFSNGVLCNPVPMRTAATISSGTFAVNTGSAGTVYSANATIYGQTIYNSAGNWTTSAEVRLSGNVSAEL